MNLANIFLKNLNKEINKVCLFGLSQEGKISWQKTRKELLDESFFLLKALKTFGVKKGDRVAISLGKSATLVASHIAILASGAIVVPLNPSLTASELEKIILKSRPSLIIITSNLFTQNPNLTNYFDGVCWVELLENNKLPNIFNLQDILLNEIKKVGKDKNKPTKLPITKVNTDDIALIVFTSGTTGAPKGVGLTHKNIISNLKSLLIDNWECSENDRFLHVLPAHHIHGLGLGIYGSLLAGNPIFLLEKFDPLITLKILSEHKISLFMGVPTLYHRMLNVEEDFNFKSMRLFVSGSAPLAVETFEGFSNRFGFTILERYGLTETLFNASNPLNGLRKAGTVGLAIKGVTIQIFDPEKLIPLKAENIGEIWIKGSNVFPGYWEDQEITKEVFYKGWFRTGDLGKFDKDGYLSIVGRIKELIIVGGTNVTPGEIEKVLGKSSDILECAVTSLPDLDLGEKIVACIVVKQMNNLKQLELALKEICQKELAAYKRPKEYFFIESLPRNIMGKLERNKLKVLVSKLSNKQ
jgi:malonyl-CoA/methylmalonyl-CoA synthetase